MAGLASDGGLYMPQRYPQVDLNFLGSIAKKNYAEFAAEIIGLYCSGIPKDVMAKLCKRAYTAANFPFAREGEDINDIVTIRNMWGDVFMAGLSNGKTLAFKDIAMILLALVHEYLLQGKVFNIVGGTSGDTGPAVLEAYSGTDNINIFMMSGGAMSDVQKAQMYANQASNVYNLKVADFDVSQLLFKELAADRPFVDHYNIGAVNSVNFARVIFQVVYSFWTYRNVTGNSGQEIDVVVPSGNFGNAQAAFIAKQMGLPIRRIIVATNENDVLHQALTTGIYQKADSADPTLSPSMDIQVASNFERTIGDVLDRDTERLAALFAPFKDTGQIDLSQEQHLFEEAGFRSIVCDTKNCLKTMADVYRKSGLMIDPHTAIAVFGAAHMSEGGVPIVAYETAREFKFPDTVKRATGVAPEMPDELVELLQAPQRFESLPDDVSALKALIRASV